MTLQVYYDEQSGSMIILAPSFIASASSPEEFWALCKAYGQYAGREAPQEPKFDLALDTSQSEQIIQYLIDKGVTKLRARTREEAAKERAEIAQEKRVAQANAELAKYGIEL